MVARRLTIGPRIRARLIKGMSLIDKNLRTREASHVIDYDNKL